ncbi:MAG: SusD/RagB family nutrient-binding outer membrane lipoprotein [Cyclobacteriaceae bacterium]|nr:SusD/RagB family nutrient-binding outer membrane lipoprotein [Cyclobacteriaceae bacterium]
MKTIFKATYYILLSVLLLFHSGCDEGFEEINTSIDFVSDPNLDLMLTPLELNMLERQYYTQGTYVAPLVGQVSSGSTFENLIEIGTFGHGYHFEWIYQNPIKNVVDFIERSKEDPELINYNSIGRIIKVYLVHRLTDVYGDIPYFEAGRGYLDQIYTPSYDKQQDIYNDLFKELNEAVAAFDADMPMPGASDIVYAGSMVKWKKFAHSLMLRLAVRILDVDQTTAKTWIITAINGGLMESNDDNFVVLYKPGSYYGQIQNGQPHIFIRYFNPTCTGRASKTQILRYFLVQIMYCVLESGFCV